MPSLNPSNYPSLVPAVSPSDTISNITSVVPSKLPSLMQSDYPSLIPSPTPSLLQVSSLYSLPSSFPSSSLTIVLSDLPTSYFKITYFFYLERPILLRTEVFTELISCSKLGDLSINKLNVMLILKNCPTTFGYCETGVSSFLPSGNSTKSCFLVKFLQSPQVLYYHMFLLVQLQNCLLINTVLLQR